MSIRHSEGFGRLKVGVVAVTVLLSGKSSLTLGRDFFFLKHGRDNQFADPGWLIWDYA